MIVNEKFLNNSGERPLLLNENEENITNKISKTVSDIFGKPYQALEEKFWVRRKSECGVVASIFTLEGVGIVGGLGTYIYNGPTYGSAFIYMASLLAMPVTLGAAYIYNKFFKDISPFILGEANLITNFYNLFEQFKEDPNDLKVANLFIEFEKIAKHECFYNIDEAGLFNSEEDKSLLRGTGKLFLMDALVKILEEKEVRSILVEKWTALIGEANIDTTNNAEPWQSLGIRNPSIESYEQFNEQKKTMASVEIANKIVTILKDIMLEQFGLKSSSIELRSIEVVKIQS